MTPGTGRAVIEIRPIPPYGRRPSRALAAVLRQSFLRADPRAGTLLMAEGQARTWRRPREWLLGLPATGRPDAVTTICLAAYTQHVKFWDYPLWRMLLLDRTGNVLAAGRERDQRQGREMWPADLFRPLRAVGISVSEEQFASPQDLGKAHPAPGH